MGYFLCGFKTARSNMNGFEKVFSEIVPAQIRRDTYRIENSSFHLIKYGGDKAIKDIEIYNEQQNSWLVIIGTPLVQLETKKEEIAFINNFFLNPCDYMLNKVDGNFVFVSYDAVKSRLIIATDFNNTTPVFYSATSKGLFLSSHELPLARFLNAEVDAVGFSQSIQLGVTWGSYTRFKNIYKTLPCQVIINMNDEIQTEHYWCPQDEKIWKGTFDDVLQKWGSLLKESVWKFYECSGHKPIINDFTAGEDSRLLLAQCHALDIPFKAHVDDVGEDIETIVAKRAAKKIGFDLILRKNSPITEEQILINALNISLSGDGYQEFTRSCSEFAMNSAYPLDDYGIVKYGGVPGGEAFRGSYYLRGKAIFPSKVRKLDCKFFIKMKYLLDFHPGLLRYSDEEFLGRVLELSNDSLQDVREFPIGTQIDHLLRIFQTSFLGLKYKNPLYLPLATNQLTRSIYWLPPRYKRGGRVTKAYTEILFPELAYIKTQNGVPTIRKTILRVPLFLPEYISPIKKIYSGAISRLLRWKQANKWYYSSNFNSHIFATLLNNAPYDKWFSSSEEMITGDFYNSEVINRILSQGKNGSCRFIPILGRIVNQELAARWVYDT